MIALIASLPLFAQKRISADQANKYIGEKVVVTGKIVRTSFSNRLKDQATTLQMGSNYAASVNVVIPGEDRRHFNNKPEEYYNQKRVAVTGTITEVNGRPQILVGGPEDIKIVEQGGTEIKPLDIEGFSRIFE